MRIYTNALIGLVTMFFIGAIASINAFAADQSRVTAKPSAKAPVGEFFTGGALSEQTGITWAGVVKSLNTPLYQEGWRIRMLGAYGRYGFLTNGQPNFSNLALFEITPGYQFKTGRLISKFYLGVHGEHQKLAYPDAYNKAQGRGYGAKFLSENWIDLPNNSFASLDASFSSLNTSYQGMLRTGTAYYVPQLTMGPELQILGNEEYYQFRAGLFGRWSRPTGALEASIGYARDYDRKSTPYVGFSWLKHF